jgi:hypothetical protein
MNYRVLLLAALAALVVLASAYDADAHPASGIVVDDRGQVYFVFTGKGVMKIGVDGKVTHVFASKGGHWMCLDREGVFANTQPRYFQRITPDGVKPAILFADGGAPLVVNRDGNLYYGSWSTKEDAFAPAAATVSRLRVDGTRDAFAPALPKTLAEMNEGVTGLATSGDGVIYVASWSAILKVKTDGTVSTMAKDITLPECDWDPPDHNQSNHKTCFRGIAVDSEGTVYAAATACRRVAKITPAGTVSIVLRSEAPWTPTDVALHDGAIYVLEYTNANDGHDETWAPRVRKSGRDGKISILADLSGPQAPADPRR